MSKLYIVPTPIGNLEDMTFRAIRVLKEVDFILAEDTRTSGKLLKHFEIATQMHSHHMHNEHKSITGIINRLKNGETCALISDAGTPAMVNSGLPNDKFVFEGFLPVKKGRQTRFLLLSEEKRTMIFYESPHKLVKTLAHFIEYFGADRQVSVSRELTKMFEETIRGTASEVLEHYTIKPPKGEIVVIVEGKK